MNKHKMNKHDLEAIMSIFHNNQCNRLNIRQSHVPYIYEDACRNSGFFVKKVKEIAEKNRLVGTALTRISHDITFYEELYRHVGAGGGAHIYLHYSCSRGTPANEGASIYWPYQANVDPLWQEFVSALSHLKLDFDFFPGSPDVRGFYEKEKTNARSDVK